MTWWSADDDATKKQFAVVRALRKEFADEKRLQMIAIRLGGEFEDWLKFQNRQPPLDPNSRMRSFYSDSKWWQAFHYPPDDARRNPFHVGLRPQTFLVGPDGKLLAVDIPDAKLRETIQAALTPAKMPSAPAKP